MPTIGNFTAWIQVDGVPLEEHNLERGGKYSATCWIASEEGKEFSVHWKAGSERQSTCGSVLLYGRFARDACVSARIAGRGSVYIKDALLSKTTVAPFVLMRLPVTCDKRPTPRQATDTEQLGTIELQLETGDVSDDRRGNDVATFKRLGAVDERSAKAIDHCDTVGKPVHLDCIKTIGFTSDGRPKMSFRFLYRPEKVLQALGIVPRAPLKRSQEDMEDDSAADSDSDEEDEQASDVDAPGGGSSQLEGSSSDANETTADDASDESGDDRKFSKVLKARIQKLSAKRAAIDAELTTLKALAQSSKDSSSKKKEKPKDGKKAGKSKADERSVKRTKTSRSR